MEKELQEQFKKVLSDNVGNFWAGTDNIISFIDQNFIGKESLEELKRYVRKGNPKCSWCEKPATKQTVKGESNLKSGGLAINDGWYCDECYQKGLKMEE